MGTNIFIPTVGAATILKENLNQFKDGLDGDLVPRTSKGVASDGIGSLGDGIFNFKSVFIGPSAQDISITEDSGGLSVKTQDTIAFRLADEPLSSVAEIGEVAYSSSCGSFSTTSTSFVDVTNLSVTVELSGLRPVLIELVPASSGTSSIGIGNTAGVFRYVRDAVNSASEIQILASRSSMPVRFVDVSKPSGTVVYKIQALTNNGAIPLSVSSYSLMVTEL